MPVCVLECLFRNVMICAFADRTSIADLFIDGKPVAVDDFDQLQHGATYSLVPCHIPADVKLRVKLMQRAFLNPGREGHLALAIARDFGPGARIRSDLRVITGTCTL
jgi:hypothetical protein